MITKKIFAYGARNLLCAFAVMLALAFAACDNGSTTGGGGPTGDPPYIGYDSEGKEYKLAISKAVSGPGTGDRDSRLVNGADDVWADSYPAGSRDGFIFKENGAFHMIDDENGPWAINVTGSWTTSGNNSLTFSGNAGSITYSYTVTSTTLTLINGDGDSQTFTKTTATVSGRSAASPAPSGKAGNKAVIGAIRRAVAADLGSPAHGSPAYGRAAAAAPQKGDKFTLTITGAIGGTSTGTVSDISGDTLKLDNDGKEFRAKIKGLFIDELPDPIPLDNGDTLPKPGTLTPTKPESDPNHTHTYSVPYSFNATQHWLECTAKDGAKFAVTDHTFNGNICSTCNYDTGGGYLTWKAVANSPFRMYTDSSGTLRASSIFGIAYGGGSWVAVGNTSRMAYSHDNGASWTGVTDNTIWINTYNDTFTIFAVAYGSAGNAGGRFVAVGDYSTMAYSDDNGASWTAADNTALRVPNSIIGIHGIAWGSAGNAGNRFVVVGDEGKMAYSSDGASWTAVENSTFTSDIYAIAYGGGSWVAGGRDGKMAYSSDSVTWTAVADSTVWQYTVSDGDTRLETIYAITYGNDRFVAVGSRGKMAYSSDGVNWTAATGSTTTVTWRSIAYGSADNIGNRFVAVSEYSRMAYSADGVTWVDNGVALTPLFGSGNNDIYAVAYGGGRFVAGDNGNIAYADW